MSKPMAPEDLAPDTYVAALFVITEHLTLAEYFGVEEPWNRRGVVRTAWLPCRDVGVPLKIAEVCLPFVLAERPDGTYVTLDTRRVRLARLSERYAKRGSSASRVSSPRSKPPGLKEIT